MLLEQLVKFKNCQESLLRHLDIADLLHALLSSLLFLKQLALAADITTIALGCHILTNLLHRLAGNNLSTDGSLNGNIKLLAGNELFQLLARPAAKGDGIILMSQC